MFNSKENQNAENDKMDLDDLIADLGRREEENKEQEVDNFQTAFTSKTPIAKARESKLIFLEDE